MTYVTEQKIIFPNNHKHFYGAKRPCFDELVPKYSIVATCKDAANSCTGQGANASIKPCRKPKIH